MYLQHFFFLKAKYKNPEVPLLLMVINYKVDPSKVSIPGSVVHCGITMNKRWLYGLYICLSKELSISGSGSLYIINLRSASATTAFSPLPTSTDYLA